MRTASAVDVGFPYQARGLCWIESVDGKLDQVHGIPGRRASVERALRGECKLLAVWPGQYAADLFEIDDLAQAASALGVKVNV